MSDEELAQFLALFVKDLLNENRWNQLIDLFRQDNFKIHQLPEQSCFTAILQAGLSAIKTPTCYRKVTAVRNNNCPVCHPSLNVIARSLPYAYCANSKLICACSGASINENNPPMMLPNGYVYSYQVSPIDAILFLKIWSSSYHILFSSLVTDETWRGERRQNQVPENRRGLRVPRGAKSLHSLRPQSFPSSKPPKTFFYCF